MPMPLTFSRIDGAAIDSVIVGDTDRGVVQFAAVCSSRIFGLACFQQGREEIMKFDRITLTPSIMGGKPCIRGMRVTVGMILGLLANRVSREQILAEYPYLEDADIDAALEYATWRVEEREDALVEAAS